MSSAQFYDVLQILVVIYFVFFQRLLTQGLWNESWFFEIMFCVNYNVSGWEWDWVEEKTFDNWIGIKYFAILR